MNSSDEPLEKWNPADLPAAAKRALEEAKLRRAEMDEQEKIRQLEIDGRDGPEPTRYGDWEKNGILSDF